MPDFPSVRTFNSHPATRVPSESPLAWTFRQPAKPVTDKSRVVMREQELAGHLLLRGEAVLLDKAVREVLGFSLPGQPLTVTRDSEDRYSLQWLSPDEWLLIVPPGEEYAIENGLRAALSDAFYSIVNVSGGQTLLILEGPSVRDILMKSSNYDVHPQNFPVGKGITTVFANTTTLLRRATDTRWELVVRRSFADYSYRWLVDAGEEYGIGVIR